MYVGHMFLDVIDEAVSNEMRLSRRFALVDIERAARKIGMYTVEEYEIVVSCLYSEHVFRVFRVKRVMDAHPPEANHGMPTAVAAALNDLRAVEEFMGSLGIERLPAPVIHERMAALAAEEV